MSESPTPTNFVSERRLGRFNLAGDMIDRHPDAIAAALSGMIVVRAEAIYHDRSIDYTAFSPSFAPVADADVIPRYVAEVTSTESGGIANIEWKVSP
ncbi:hypothetical protein [Azospirillum sp. TSO5]|uniref:hypothetical protein n=1 Tax=Azospirillum sp. TSO5 TaxID=716760 RepID=UPI000D619293|nr:hypothetical protein [Azospirillum sp. TSO5]PWC95462.1 hypothetical protein TSO5_10595 [Azospirillum sp. TSO5]